jgi:hypothetical protein
MAADARLAELRAEADERAQQLPGLEEVVEDAGRQRLAAYYLYSALLAGVIHDGELLPERWPAELSEPMNGLGLTHLAPRTERGLDAELTPAEQSMRRSSGREIEFAELVVDLINQGVSGLMFGDDGEVRVAEESDTAGPDLEIVARGQILHRCKARDHWELVAQHLASAATGEDPVGDSQNARKSPAQRARRLKEFGISHTVSLSAGLAVHVHPLGAVAGVGTRLVRERIQTGRQHSDAFHRLSQALHGLRVKADGELRRRPARPAA